LSFDLGLECWSWPHFLTTIVGLFKFELDTRLTRNSSGDEIANVNFLYNDIVHVYTTK